MPRQRRAQKDDPRSPRKKVVHKNQRSSQTNGDYTPKKLKWVECRASIIHSTYLTTKLYATVSTAPLAMIAARSVFCISMAIVIGPTPPGTGVMAPATSLASSK